MSQKSTQKVPEKIFAIKKKTEISLIDLNEENEGEKIEEKKEVVAPKITFEPNETIKVTDGPFMNFSGIIEEVDPERGKLKISVSIFGRTAPVELEYWQVERVAE